MKSRLKKSAAQRTERNSGQQLEEAEAAGKEEKPEARRQKSWVRRGKGTKRKAVVTRSRRDSGVRRGEEREPGAAGSPPPRRSRSGESKREPGGARPGRVRLRAGQTQKGRAGWAAGREARGRAPAGPCGRGGGAALARISGYK